MKGKYLASRQDFENLEMYTEGLIRSMADRLLQGEIGPDPYADGSVCPCNYCDYRRSAATSPGTASAPWERPPWKTSPPPVNRQRKESPVHEALSHPRPADPGGPGPQKALPSPRPKGPELDLGAGAGHFPPGGRHPGGAAAGSGKTAVLVERVIRRITEGPSPVPADRFLVVTFTNAAAAEMRSRIAPPPPGKNRGGAGKLPSWSGSCSLLSKARICTMDAFFSAMVRENFERLGVSPPSASPTSRSWPPCGPEPWTRCWSGGSPNRTPTFWRRQSILATKAGSLGREVLNVYEKTRSLPDPNGWMEAQQALYGRPSLRRKPPGGRSSCPGPATPSRPGRKPPGGSGRC